VVGSGLAPSGRPGLPGVSLVDLLGQDNAPDAYGVGAWTRQQALVTSCATVARTAASDANGTFF